MSEESAELEVLDDSLGHRSIIEKDGKFIAVADTERVLEFPQTPTAKWVEEQLTGNQWRIIHSRNIKLNPQLICSMFKDAKKGLSKRAILARHGMPPHRWSEWQRKADQGQEPYYLWSQCMTYAAAQVEDNILKDVRLQAQGDFKAAKWLLEHINRDEYGPTPKEQTVNIHGDVNATQTTNNNETSVNYMTDEHAVEVAQLLKSIGVIPQIEAPVDAEVIEDE